MRHVQDGAGEVTSLDDSVVEIIAEAIHNSWRELRVGTDLYYTDEHKTWTRPLEATIGPRG